MDAFEELVLAFPERERERVRKIVAQWNESWNCAYAEIKGMADKPSNREYRANIYAALDRCPPDGFTVEFAKEFGVSIGEASILVNESIGRI